jgi:hypothetical protein
MSNETEIVVRRASYRKGLSAIFGECVFQQPQTGGNHTVGHLAATFGVTILQLDALGASALKERIGRPRQMSASGAHVPRLCSSLANHHLEIPAFNAIGAPHSGHSRLMERF